MKKTLVMVFGALLLVSLTGCGAKNQVKCTSTSTELGMEMKTEVIADLDKDNNIKALSATIDFGSKETANTMCSLYKLSEQEGLSVSCSGSKMTIKGYDKMISDEDDDVKLIGMSKDDFVKGMESQGATCK